MWFKKLTGFVEESPEQVRRNIVIEDSSLKSLVNGKTITYGSLEIPTLKQLRDRVGNCSYLTKKTSLQEIVANVQNLHKDKANAGALFQVASQFNLLEMVSPRVTPEDGISDYESDRTQGPACAVAAGAGTIYRNYFVNVNGKIGQSADNQIDCLKDIGAALGNVNNRLWKMKNGYALASNQGLAEITRRLRQANENELDELRSLLRVGIQWKTQVTVDNSEHLVSQIYCSALPVTYSYSPPSAWAKFAQLILEASYEATICTAILNSVENGNNRLFLTLLGGGAFGNDTNWIINAIERALTIYRNTNLDVNIVSYGSSRSSVQNLINQFNS